MRNVRCCVFTWVMTSAENSILVINHIVVVIVCFIEKVNKNCTKNCEIVVFISNSTLLIP